MATKQEIFSIINLIKRLPNSPITADPRSLDEVVTLFHAVLEDLPSEMVKAATVQYCSEGNPFFPTPGTLRDKAMDLQMLALGIPTPAEAWGMVLTGVKHVESMFCEAGGNLRDTYINQQTKDNLWAYEGHLRDCGTCTLGGIREVYAHPAVAETVRLLGGRDVILTDNPTADRARFIDGFREVVARERMKMSMTPTVARYVEDNRLIALDTGEKNYLEAQTRRLAEGMNK